MHFIRTQSRVLKSESSEILAVLLVAFTETSSSCVLMLISVIAFMRLRIIVIIGLRVAFAIQHN